jgi:hypothetical protein
MISRGETGDPGGCDSDAIFFGFNLFGNADDHLVKATRWYLESQCRLLPGSGNVFVYRVRVSSESRPRFHGHEHEISALPLNLFEQPANSFFQ